MKESITQTFSMTTIKVLSMLMIVFCAFSVQAQSRADLLTESFDGTSMPAGWSIIGAGQSNWSISPTSEAGGSPNEAMLAWEPQFNGISRLVTPSFDLTNVESVVVSFKHGLDNYSGSHTLGIATSSDGSNWHIGWSQSFSSSGAWTVNQVITTEDMGNDEVKFCIFYNGNSYNINYWYFDDVKLFVQEELDASLDKILVNNYLAAGNIPVDFKVSNNGVNPINALTVNYQIDNNSIVTEDFSNLNLTTFGTTDLVFEETAFLIPGTYTLKVWISEVNGTANEGDELEKNISVATASVERNVMIEHFSSSTCGPCVSVNTAMHNLTNNNPGKYCYIKYQMNWPGNGDPYYTAEGGVRRSYYGVNAVPYVVAEGGKYAANPAFSQTQMNQYYAVPAYVDIRGSFQVEGNTINIKADVFPNISANNLKLFVVVNEKETHNNVGGNGETTFHHVMMKMLPNAQGTAINLVAGEAQTFEFSHDMSSTHVEEMSDLEVAIFIQDLSSSELFNSRFAYEYSDIHPYPIENLQVAKEGTDLNVSWSANAMSNPTGYKIKINGELVEENYQEETYTMNNATEAFYAVQIEALYGEMTSVAVTKTSLDEENCEAVSELNGVVDAQNVVLTWTASATATGYKVYRDDVMLAELENVTTYTDLDVAEGIYNYKLIALCPNNMESDPINIEVIVEYSSINEMDENITIFPNPAKDFVKIEGNNIETISIFNTLGQLIKTITVNNNSINVSISDLQQGIYIFDVKTVSSSIRNRVIVTK